MAVNAGELTGQLEELIAAWDRRGRRVEHAREAAIARDAAGFDRLAVLATNLAVGRQPDTGDPP